MKTFLTLIAFALAPVAAKKSKVRFIHGGFGGGFAVVGSKASRVGIIGGGPVPHGGFAVVGSKGSKVKFIGGGPVVPAGFAPPIVGGPMGPGLRGPGGPGGPPQVQQPTGPRTGTTNTRSMPNNNNNYQKNVARPATGPMGPATGPTGFPPSQGTNRGPLFPKHGKTDNSVYFSNAQPISASLATVLAAMISLLLL